MNRVASLMLSLILVSGSAIACPEGIENWCVVNRAARKYQCERFHHVVVLLKGQGKLQHSGVREQDATPLEVGARTRVYASDRIWLDKASELEFQERLKLDQGLQFAEAFTFDTFDEGEPSWYSFAQWENPTRQSLTDAPSGCLAHVTAVELRALTPEVPYLLSPRQTKLLNPRPSFEWNPVEGVSHYQLEIWCESIDPFEPLYEERFSADITGVEYPLQQPLQVSHVYTAEVKAFRNYSDLPASELADGEEAGGTFSLLSTEDALLASSLIESLELEATNSELGLLKVLPVLEYFGLYDRALKETQRVLQATPSPTLRLQAGRYYEVLGLEREAAAEYGVIVAQVDSGEQLGLVEAQTRLALLVQGSDPEGSHALAVLALQAWRELGVKGPVDELRAVINTHRGE